MDTSTLHPSTTARTSFSTERQYADSDIQHLIRSLQLGGNEENFLANEFDVKEHANTALQCGLSISEQLARLSDGILILNKELHTQVVAHHDDLLSQATGVETLEGVLQMMQTRIQSLLATTERIRSRVTEPFHRITVRVNQLTRLQETCDLLRRIIRMLYLCKRLHSQLQGGTREITKAAQSLSELGYLSEGVDLSGIEVLEKERRLISQARIDVENQAKKMIESGIQNMNQNQTATSLQVFYNLSLLSATVNQVLGNLHDSVSKYIDNCLDTNLLCGPGPDSKVAPGKVNLPANTALFRANLWTSMEKLMDMFYTSCSQVQHLQKVLVKKRDPVSQVAFITDYAKENNPCITQNYWEKIMAMFQKKLQYACQRSNLLKQAFEGEYPKLLRLCRDLWVRLVQHVQIAMTDSLASVMGESDSIISVKQFAAEEGLRKAVNLFENAYLSRSLSRLFDPINLVFQHGSLAVPSTDELDGIVKTISSELNVSSFDPKLNIAICKNVAKTVKLFSVKCEQLLCTDGEASQVINAATQGQKRNAAVVNALHHLQLAVKMLVDTLGNPEKEGICTIVQSLQSLNSLMKTAIQPLLDSITDCMEAIILTMHQEDFSGDVAGQTESQCSLYMRELQGFLSRVQTDYLSLFECQDFIMESVHPLVCNSIELFVRHASLLRPIAEGGKMRLAADFAQMELAVNPLCKRVGDLGKSYKLLRAFRPMLFQSSEHIPQNHAIGDIIPYSTVIHFLFTKAPEELKSPHQVSGWSLSRYTQWLDDHPSEKDRLTLIRGTLDCYVISVSARQGTEYASVYPVMLELLQKGLQD